MFIRKTKKIYKEKTYYNYLLVESVNTPKGPRQKIICSLGSLEPRPREEWLKLAHKIEDALAGQGDLANTEDEEVRGIVDKIKRRRRKSQKADDIVAVHTDRVSVEEAREAGAVHVGMRFWKRLELDRILKEAKLDKKSRLLTCLMTLNRLISPRSEWAMPDWFRRTALGDILRVNLEHQDAQALYRNLDRLHSRREKIESALFRRECDLFDLDERVYLYDLTSTYFEGQCSSNEKAMRGYSRDNRPDCKQVVVGLVLNRDGFPMAHEVFSGNVRDSKTVGDVLDLLKRRGFLKKGNTIVVDRGMAYDENLEEIRSRGLHYIVACRQSERNYYLGEFEDERGFAEVIRPVSSTNSMQKKSRVWIKRNAGEKETHVLCISDGRKEKDRAIREKHEKKFMSDVKRLKESVKKGRLKKEAKINQRIGRLLERYPRVARYYRLSLENGRVLCEREEEKTEQAARLDGGYLMKTTRMDISEEEIWKTYMLLTRVESAFRSIKSPLAERPIYHQRTDRVETHIFLCILAYHLLISIEQTLRTKGIHTSWERVREKLSTHQICTVVLPAEGGEVLKIRRDTKPEKEHLELYQALEMEPEIIEPRKTWITKNAES